MAKDTKKKKESEIIQNATTSTKLVPSHSFDNNDIGGIDALKSILSSNNKGDQGIGYDESAEELSFQTGKSFDPERHEFLHDSLNVELQKEKMQQQIEIDRKAGIQEQEEQKKKHPEYWNATGDYIGPTDNNSDLTDIKPVPEPTRTWQPYEQEFYLLREKNKLSTSGPEYEANLKIYQGMKSKPKLNSNKTK